MDKRYYSKYCCCIITENIKGNTLWEGCTHRLDSMTFPNPDIEPSAKNKCIERAKFIRNNKQNFSKSMIAVIPAIIQEILED
jgi:hypothetical protein